MIRSLPAADPVPRVVLDVRCVRPAFDSRDPPLRGGVATLCGRRRAVPSPPALRPAAADRSALRAALRGGPTSTHRFARPKYCGSPNLFCALTGRPAEGPPTVALGPAALGGRRNLRDRPKDPGSIRSPLHHRGTLRRSHGRNPKRGPKARPRRRSPRTARLLRRQRPARHGP